jgi:hypothetical protein
VPTSVEPNTAKSGYQAPNPQEKGQGIERETRLITHQQQKSTIAHHGTKEQFRKKEIGTNAIALVGKLVITTTPLKAQNDKIKAEKKIKGKK